MPLTAARPGIGWVLFISMVVFCKGAEGATNDASAVTWLEATGGYATAFGNGLSYAGPAFGLTLERQLGAHLLLSGRALVQLGSSNFATGPGVNLSAWSRAVTLQASLAYIVKIAEQLEFVPNLVVDGTVLWSATQIGTAEKRETAALFGVGPSVGFRLRFSTFHLSLNGQALFVPQRFASPVAALFAGIGAPL